MAMSQKLIKFLDKNKIKYELLKHKKVYTAYDKAATLRVPEKIVGKTLVVKLDKNIALVLISANKNLDKQKFLQIANKWKNSCGHIRVTSRAKRGTLRYSHADFVKENWMKKNLKGVKIGAIPPFGILWPAIGGSASGGKLPTFIDRGLMTNSKIIINAGDYNWSIKINPAVLKKIIPDLVIGNFGKKR